MAPSMRIVFGLLTFVTVGMIIGTLFIHLPQFHNITTISDSMSCDYDLFIAPTALYHTTMDHGFDALLVFAFNNFFVLVKRCLILAQFGWG